MLLTALLMGFAGGLHCAGMCGPLVLAATARNPLMANKIIYNTGRVVTYGLLGALAGTIGGLLNISPFQNVLAYVLGGIFLLIGFGAINGVQVPFLTTFVNRFTMWLKSQFGSLLKGRRNIFFLGALNGMLPCGLTYLALTYCFTLDSFADGFLFMIVFGFGTVPVMVGSMWILGIVLKKTNLNYQKVSMVIMIVLGSLVIGRTFTTHAQTGRLDAQSAGIIDEVICK